jgi:oligosaccharide reducing-end xylanase
MLGAAEGGLYRNLFAEMLHKSDAEVEKKLQDTWRFLFEGNVSTEAIYVPVGETPEGDKLGYVLNTESGWVTSEAMSYGMMVAVQYDRRETFDALWSWASRYMRHVTGRYKGFFAWKCSLAGRKLDGTPAPDAEEWIATALIFANNRWMSQGRYDYEKEAVALLLGMGDPRRGMFTKHGEVTLNPVRPVITNPSYHLPHFYEVWARFLNDRGQYQLASFYLQAAERSRRLLHKAVDQHTGLSADYTDYEGVGVKDLAGHSNFQWDAWRVVANVAVDWSWWRRDAWQQREADTLQAFLIRQGIQDYPSTYALNGTALLKSHSVGLVAVNAVASLAATDRNVASAFVAELWNAAIPRNQWRYYNGMLVFLSLLQVSGRYRSLY